MALHIKGEGISEVWKRLLMNLLYEGRVVRPRGKLTKEILNVVIEVEKGNYNVIISEKRDLNYRFLIAEWLWIQAGIDQLNVLSQYNSRMVEFSDDGIILSGAYGPRLMPQMDYIKCNLKIPDTRQAVATIWTPSPDPSKDIPCTISLQWFIRDKKIHCTVTMRSSDVWLGLPHDYFVFSQLTNYLGSLLNYNIGSVTMNLASSHLYEKDFEMAQKVLEQGVDNIASPLIPTGSTPVDSTNLLKMLNKENTYLMEPWSSYGQALKHNKSTALEVLYGISPI
jgi:thymidylate synthase